MTKRKLTKHDDDTCPHLVRASLLEAENARLIDEVDLMHSSKLVYFIHGEGRWANVVEENARLKAEVERLTNENGNNFVLKEEWYLKCLSARADVERLRKAGDAMADKASLAGCSECFGMFNDLEKSLDEWNAAKEGKSV